MTHRQPKRSRSKTTLPPQLAAGTRHAAGIDSGAAVHWGAVPPSHDPHPIRRVGASTADLEALADGLATWRITPIALASPGVSWIPLLARLDPRGFAVLWVDPQQVKKSTGRPKSARHDCQGIPRLHTFGLLAGAVRPADHVGGRRRDLRHRARRLTSAAPPRQPMQQALTPMNMKRPQVGSAMTGVPGLAIIHALRAGERHPAPLAHLRADRCQHDEATRAHALQRHGREEPLFAWAQAVAL